MARLATKDNPLLRQVKQLIEEQFGELIEFRRSLHREPEVAWKEFRTTEKIISFLTKQGIKTISRPLDTGVVAELPSRTGLPTIALRADIDALPIRDEKNVPYQSRNEGICHACGHDVHTAVMCGVAAVLNRLKTPLPVNVRFLFQPAEEPIPSGAPRFMEAGVLEGVESIWGLHVEPSLPLATVGLTDGWVNARSIRLEWKLRGSGGHSARPHLTANPISAGAALLMKASHQVTSGWNQPDQPVVLTFTRFISGDGYNVIPKEAAITATLRVTSPEAEAALLRELTSLTRQIGKEKGVEAEFTHRAGAPPVINHPEIVSRFIRNLEQSGLREFRIEHNFRSMGGDDFGWYAQALPAALVRFGIAREGKSAPALHTGTFDVPEEVIKLAVLFFVWQVLNW